MHTSQAFYDRNKKLILNRNSKFTCSCETYGSDRMFFFVSVLVA